jgi:hypothetical protein
MMELYSKDAVSEEIAEIRKESTEAFGEESPIESMLTTIENDSPESLEFEILQTRNFELAGEKHPETGVPFERKMVENSDGKLMEGVFPDFHEFRMYETNLPENLLKETDAKQYRFCNEKLKEYFDQGSIEKEQFSERQLEQITNGDKPEGYIWHHNEVPGRMELVESDIHVSTAHTGGRSIWGGGEKARI